MKKVMLVVTMFLVLMMSMSSHSYAATLVKLSKSDQRSAIQMVKSSSYGYNTTSLSKGLSKHFYGQTWSYLYSPSQKLDVVQYIGYTTTPDDPYHVSKIKIQFTFDLYYEDYSVYYMTFDGAVVPDEDIHIFLNEITQ